MALHPFIEFECGIVKFPPTYQLPTHTHTHKKSLIYRNPETYAVVFYCVLCFGCGFCVMGLAPWALGCRIFKAILFLHFFGGLCTFQKKSLEITKNKCHIPGGSSHFLHSKEKLHYNLLQHKQGALLHWIQPCSKAEEKDTFSR